MSINEYWLRKTILDKVRRNSFQCNRYIEDANDVITEENCNDINNALSISIKKIQELLKLNEKEEYINFVDFNIASKILQLHDVLKDAVEEIDGGDYDSVQTEISTSIDKAEEIIDIYDEEY